MFGVLRNQSPRIIWKSEPRIATAGNIVIERMT
ncbi:MAG: hypothetical protein AVDCRST_MAG59-57 [uncultured Thermomicrobiales bacterium]|uniref:Uncharacterized protein n=1 Tax=uncultured Thermomicrobiales bacterium TaxID=1645740 RepID=A0A6J4TVB3_9BACT|nr:MAG: hypothetical protein AVDCRST_MAG59-57 [uncultured Thermomicrobiales bacterium]